MIRLRNVAATIGGQLARGNGEMIPRLTWVCVASIALMAFACGRQAPEAPAKKSQPSDPLANFTLHVSNQSFAITPVDIKVQIDGNVVVDQLFDVGGQHNWKTYKLRLSPGQHIIVVTSKEGAASLTKTFQIKDKHWGVLDYWHYPDFTPPTTKHFSFDIHDGPVYFQQECGTGGLVRPCFLPRAQGANGTRGHDGQGLPCYIPKHGFNGQSHNI